MVEVIKIKEISDKYALVLFKNLPPWRKGQYFILREEDTLKCEQVFPLLHEEGTGFFLLSSSRIYKSIKEKGYVNFIEGPCGKPLNISSYKKPLCVGKGEGIFALISAVGRKGVFFLYEDEIFEVENYEIRAIDDINHLKEIIERENCDVILSAGDNRLSEDIACMDISIDRIACVNVPVLDATGLCLICRLYVDGKLKLACVDGLWFPANKVDWNSLKAMEAAFKDA